MGTALAAAGALTAGWPAGRPVLRRLGAGGAVGVLAARGVLGLAGRTRLVSPASVSANFVRLDRRLYSPLCLALAGLSALSALPDRSSGAGGLTQQPAAPGRGRDAPADALAAGRGLKIKPMRRESSTVVVVVGEVGDGLLAGLGRFPHVSVARAPATGPAIGSGGTCGGAAQLGGGRASHAGGGAATVDVRSRAR